MSHRPILIVDIDPTHLSDRERALRALYGAPAGQPLIAVDELVRPLDPVPIARAPKAKFQRAPVNKPYRKEKSAALKRLLAK